MGRNDDFRKILRDYSKTRPTFGFRTKKLFVFGGIDFNAKFFHVNTRKEFTYYLSTNQKVLCHVYSLALRHFCSVRMNNHTSSLSSSSPLETVVTDPLRPLWASMPVALQH
jgi:hypothetical protein